MQRSGCEYMTRESLRVGVTVAPAGNRMWLVLDSERDVEVSAAVADNGAMAKAAYMSALGNSCWALQRGSVNELACQWS